MPVQALVALPPEIIEVVFVVGNIKMRQLAHAELKLNITAFGYLMRVFDSALVVFEDGSHLILGLHIEFLGLELHPVGVVEGAVGLYAEQDAVYLAVLFFYVMAVVGGDHTDAYFIRDLREIWQYPFLLVYSVILQLYKEVVSAEQVAVIPRFVLRLFIISGGEQARDLSRQAGGKADQALVMLFKQLVVDPRLGVKALGKAAGDELDKVLIAREVFAEQNHMVVFVVARGFVKARLGRDVDLAADDWLYSLFFAGAVKVDHAEHYAVVGDSERIKALLLCGGGDPVDPARAVKQAVLGMNM